MAEGDKVAVDVNSNEFQNAVAAAALILDKQREEKGKWIRALILKYPLRAANSIGFGALFLGTAIGFFARGFFS